MKNLSKYSSIILPVFIAIVFISAYLPAKITYTLSKEFTVTINGTSNLHDWNEKAEIVTGNGTLIRNSDGSYELESINIKINVHSIKSNEGSTMNNNTYKALKADLHPEIIFILASAVQSNKNPSEEKTILANGKLTLAGVTRNINMQVKIFIQSSGKLAFRGSYKLKMSDYNIIAPTALFGTIRTGDEITINFKSTFEPIVH